MRNEANKLAVIGVDLGEPGGDQTAVAVFRRTGKSQLARWLLVTRPVGYRMRIRSERARLGKRLAGYAPRPVRARHLAKLKRYERRAFDGRG